MVNGQIHVDFGSINWQSHVLLWKGENCKYLGYVLSHLKEPKPSKFIHRCLLCDDSCCLLYLPLQCFTWMYTVTRPERDSGERKRNKSEPELYRVIWMEIQSSYLSIHVRRSCCDRNRFQFICTNTKMTTKTTTTTTTTFKKRIKFNSVNMET